MEENIYTWEKRFMQKHYSYRDSYPDPLDATQGTTVLFPPSPPAPLPPATQALLAFATQAALAVPGTVYYPFGYNARNWSTGVAALTNAGIAGSRFAWPQGPQPPTFAEATGEYASGTIVPRAQCYAREVLVYVTEDTWIRFVSLNPIYLTLLAHGYSFERIAVLGVPMLITEVEHFVARRDKDTFYPTYATAIVFRADTVAGTIYISAEGNVEGGE